MAGNRMQTDESDASGNREAVKVCTACGQEKPIEAFFASHLDKKRRKWKGACKVCTAERQGGGQTKNELAREQRLRDFPGSKTCTGCREHKPLADFGRPPEEARPRACGACILPAVPYVPVSGQDGAAGAQGGGLSIIRGSVSTRHMKSPARS